VQKTVAGLALLLAALVLVQAPHASARRGIASGRGLTAAPLLTGIYDTILQARFDEARNALASACPPAPAAACDALREVALWWEIQQNQGSRLLDERLQVAAATAVASAAAWTEREPTSGEAWFYLAGAYAPIAQWRVLRGERLAAARDGKRIKDALERALSIDPGLHDAWFGIGLYHYYADVAPAALKFLRFLLLLPGGDRAQGLKEMLRARDHGELLRGEADYQLHWLYLWYEQKPALALELLQRLDARYPTNPLFLQRIADVQHVYFSDHQASADSWKTLLDRASASQVMLAPLAAARARVGLAAEQIELSAAGAAIAMLEPVIRERSREPYGVQALAHLTRGDAYVAIGELQHALSSYSQAIDTAPNDDPDRIRTRARDGIARARSRR
jgi:tetratricopeptide (TPR) repeat protein